MTNSIIFGLHVPVSCINAQSLESITSFLHNLSLSFSKVVLEGGKLHVSFTTVKLALEGAIKLLHFSKYRQPLLIDGISMSFSTVSGYSLRNICRIRKENGTSRLPIHYSAIRRDLCEVLGGSNFQLVDSPEAYELVVAVKTVKDKDTIANLSNTKKLYLAGLHWAYVSNNTKKRKRSPRKPSRGVVFRKYLIFARAKTTELVSEVNIALQNEYASDKMELLLTHVKHELDTRTFTSGPKVQESQFEKTIREEISIGLEKSRDKLEYVLNKRKADKKVEVLYTACLTMSHKLTNYLRMFALNGKSDEIEKVTDEIHTFLSEIASVRSDLEKIPSMFDTELAIEGWRTSISTILKGNIESVQLLLQIANAASA